MVDAVHLEVYPPYRGQSCREFNPLSRSLWIIACPEFDRLSHRLVALKRENVRLGVIRPLARRNLLDGRSRVVCG